LLLSDKAVDILLRDAEEPKLIDSGQIDGREYYRVQIRRPDGLAVLWIDKETLVLRRMILPTDDLRRRITDSIGGASIDTLSLVAEFPGAQLNGPVDPVAFQFQAPAGAEIVKFFVPPDPAQLLAKMVPNFNFVDMEGKPITPQSLAGKITVLDFWATWCEPCKISMPSMQKVYEKYKDNDKVAFLAVSLDEPSVDNKAVEDVLKQLDVTIPVCRDLERTALAFKFPGIPTSFIIDAGGIVQDYEAGARPDLAAVLTDKIEKLLAGENIYQAPLKEYQDRLKKYMSSQEPDAGADIEEHAVPQAEIAKSSPPQTFKLSQVWKCPDLKSPGNILVLNSPGAQPRLLVTENFKSIAEVGLDGKLIALHEPKMGDQEFFTNIRVFTDANGKYYIAAFAAGQQRCHLFDEQWNLLLSFPQEALENPHSGIADVQLGDLDGDGTPKMYVGYLGVVGVQAVSLEGKRIWSNRLVSNVQHLAVTDPNADGLRDLLCTNNSGTIAVLDAKGQRQSEISVPNRMIYWITGADLQESGPLQWCGLSASKLGENVALGFNLKGDELWDYTLPVGVQQQPIEPIIAGKITRQGPGQWLLPGPDGSINIISAKGKPVDSFNYGATLQGLATVEIDGQPALIVSSPNGLEAWKIE
jgi:thiol-disulfide isomerase/thioredoxin